MNSAPRGRWAAKTRLAGLTLAAGCLAGAWLLSAGAGATTTVTAIEGGTAISISGAGDRPNNITIREKTNAQTGPFYEIYDPEGVTELPPGCSREDANTIRCPTAGIVRIFVFGGALDDTVIFDLRSVVETIAILADGDDTIVSGPGRDTQNGGPGNDQQHGGAGDDTQIGGPGNDQQSGQGGNDKQIGGPGNDTQKGGPGKDTQNCGGGKDDKGVGGGGADKQKGCEVGKP